MKHFILSFLLILLSHWGITQKINSDDVKKIYKIEDSMKRYALSVLQDSMLQNRMTSDSTFTKQLVRCLKTKNSFYYPFDSLYTISKLYAPDSSFRIFTWQININPNLIIQHGAIQLHTEDGTLKLIPLFDRSDAMLNLEDTIVSNVNWIGAIYYKIIMHTIQNNNFYTLIGFDENNSETNKKIIEVMHFENGRPVFGGKFFTLPKEETQSKSPVRFIMEYKKDAGAKLNYDNELEMIMKEHLVSNTNEPSKKSTLVGDGDYDGFVWRNQKWNFVSKIFTQATPEGNVPIPTPIRDEKGTIDDTKLKGREKEN